MYRDNLIKNVPAWLKNVPRWVPLDNEKRTLVDIEKNLFSFDHAFEWIVKQQAKWIGFVIGESWGCYQYEDIAGVRVEDFQEPLFFEWKDNKTYHLIGHFADTKEGKEIAEAFSIRKAIFITGIPATGPYTEIIDGLTVHTVPAATEEAKVKTDVPDLITFDADYFNNTDIPEPEPIIDSILYPGLGMLGAPAKMGKTYMCLQLSCSVATGQAFLGFDILRPGPVLYLDLQGTRARTKKRLREIGFSKMPNKLTLAYAARTTDSGLVEQLEKWISCCTESPSLIVIDMFEQVKGSQRRTEDAYRADNRILEPLHDLAFKHNISVLCVMHTRKGARGNKILPDEDPFQEILGSIGQFGTADCAWMITGSPKAERKRFSVICRDNDSGMMDFEAVFNKCRWQIAGTVEDCEEQRENDRYDHNPIVFTVRKLIEEAPSGWIGTMSDLMQEVTSKTKTYPATSPEQMRKMLANVEYRLSCEGMLIKCLDPKGGKRGRRYKIYKNDPEQQFIY